MFFSEREGGSWEVNGHVADQHHRTSTTEGYTPKVTELLSDANNNLEKGLLLCLQGNRQRLPRDSLTPKGAPKVLDLRECRGAWRLMSAS